MENQTPVLLPTHIIAAAGVVKNEKGEILLVKHHRDGWVFPGGIVEPGENLLELNLDVNLADYYEIDESIQP